MADPAAPLQHTPLAEVARAAVARSGPFAG